MLCIPAKAHRNRIARDRVVESAGLRRADAEVPHRAGCLPAAAGGGLRLPELGCIVGGIAHRLGKHLRRCRRCRQCNSNRPARCSRACHLSRAAGKRLKRTRPTASHGPNERFQPLLKRRGILSRKLLFVLNDGSPNIGDSGCLFLRAMTPGQWSSILPLSGPGGSRRGQTSGALRFGIPRRRRGAA